MDDKEIEEVVAICQEYELGMNAGRLNLSMDNNKNQLATPKYYAWMLGHNIGIQNELIELDEGYIN